MSQDWYSALVTVVCVIENAGMTSEWRNAVVFQAESRDHARSRAIEIASRYCDEYRNGSGQMVRWIPKAVETLDYLGPQIEDGQEIYWEPRDFHPPDAGVKWGGSFDLERSPFAETGLAPSGIGPVRYGNTR